MEDAIIYGTGALGRYVGEQLLHHQMYPKYQIIGYCSEDAKDIHTKIHGLEVISLTELECMPKTQLLILAVADPHGLLSRLLDKGFRNIKYYTAISRFVRQQFLPEGENKIVPEISRPIEKVPVKIRKILYVQDGLCVRTYKISRMMHDLGIHVDLAYHARVPDKDMTPHFARVMHIESIHEFLGYVNQSDYDMLHVSVEHDCSLCVLCLNANKPVVYDCHDMAGTQFNTQSSDYVLEYLANQNSHGKLYVSEGQRDYAIRQLEATPNPYFILGNLISEHLKPSARLEKLSSMDGKLHCVYEGNLSADPSSVRYLEPMFLQLAHAEIVVHFYTFDAIKEYSYFQALADKHPNLIWEGNRSENQLILELTQYDVGLMLFNIISERMFHIGTTIPNKMFDYPNAGLPAVYNIPSFYENFYRQHPIGDFVDFTQPLYPQIERVSKIKIPNGYLQDHELTMESQAENLLNFYGQVILNKKKADEIKCDTH